MINIIRADSQNRDFIGLVKLFDSFLAEKDGSEHAFYAQFNKTEPDIYFNNYRQLSIRTVRALSKQNVKIISVSMCSIRGIKRI